MTIPYSLYHNQQPTNFPEKILLGLYEQMILDETEYMGWLNAFKNRVPDYSLLNLATDGLPLKLHTIREDKSDRWREGMRIHMVINNRTKNRYQFAPVLRVKSIQNIFITYRGYGGLEISVDDRYLYNEDIERIAINDGFRDREHFEKWFIPVVESMPFESFSGKIIHWTNLKY